MFKIKEYISNLFKGGNGVMSVSESRKKNNINLIYQHIEDYFIWKFTKEEISKMTNVLYDSNGKTILYSACEKKDFPLIKACIELGYDSNIKNKDVIEDGFRKPGYVNKTGLYTLLNNVDDSNESKMLEMITFLLDNKADPKICNMYTYHKYKDVTLAMIKHGSIIVDDSEKDSAYEVRSEYSKMLTHKKTFESRDIQEALFNSQPEIMKKFSKYVNIHPVLLVEYEYLFDCEELGLI